MATVELLSDGARRKVSEDYHDLSDRAMRILEESGIARLLENSSAEYVSFINSRARAFPHESGLHLIMNSFVYCAKEMPGLVGPLVEQIDAAVEMLDGTQTEDEKFNMVVCLMSVYLAKLYLSRS